MIYIELFRLFGSIFVDNDKANQSISETDKKGQGVANTLGEGIKTAAKWGAALAAGATVAIGGLMAAVNKTAEYADEIDKLSERTGINREELQRWKYAAEQSGADVGKLEVGIKTLSNSMDGAVNGNKAAIEAFGKLGISLDDLKNKSQEEIFSDVMFSLADMEQGSARNALGNDVLGKSYTEMMPLLNQASDGMMGLMNRADELGIVMSEDSVKANVVYGDTMADVKAAAFGVFAGLTNELLPTFQKFLDWILANMPAIQEFVRAAFDKAREVIVQASDAIQALTGWFSDHWGIMQPILIGLAAAVATYGLIAGAIAIVAAATTAWTAVTAFFGLTLGATMIPIWAIVAAIGLLVAAGVALYNNWDEVSAFLSKTWDWIKETAVNVFNAILDFFKEWGPLMLAILSGPIGLLILFIVTNWDKIKEYTVIAFNFIKDIILDIWSGISNGIKGFINNIIDGVNGMVSSITNGINSVITLINKIPGIEIPKINAPQIPGLAEGGDITRSGRVLVGENGPELLDLQAGARVTPLKSGGITINITDAMIMDDYGVDRLMDRVIGRARALGVA